jgi:hypothetical protein
MRDSFIFTLSLTVITPSVHCDIYNNIYDSSLTSDDRERRIQL